MILKFQLNSRLDADLNVSTSSEAIVDTDAEAQDAGETFMRLAWAFWRGIDDGRIKIERESSGV